jgi:hypothetical protein
MQSPTAAAVTTAAKIQNAGLQSAEMPIAVSRGSLAKETNIHKNTNDRKTKAASATFFTILRICMGRNTGLDDTPLRKAV